MDIKKYTICTEVDRETKEQFRALCKRKGFTVNGYIRHLIKREIENEKCHHN